MGAGAEGEGDVTAAAGRPDDGVDQLLTGGAAEEEGEDDVVHVFAASAEGDATATAGRPDDGVDQLLTVGAGVDDEEDGVCQLLTGGAAEEEGEPDGIHFFAAPPGAFLSGEILETGFKPRCGP